MKRFLRNLTVAALGLFVAVVGAHAAATLKVSGISAAPGSVQPGQSATFTVTVTNTATSPTGGGTGNDFTGGTVDVSVTLTSLTTDPIVLGSQSVSLPAITAAGSGTVEVTFTVPTKYSQSAAYFVTAEMGFSPTSPASATAALSAPLDEVSMTSFGSGYTSAPTVNFTGGGGSGAVGRAIVAGGAVISVDLLNKGTGYSSAPTITLVGGGGAGATATARIRGSVGSTTTLLSGGSGYRSTPRVLLSGGSGGANATATATLTGSGVSSIAVTSAGTGYTSAPTVGFSGGGGSGATATASFTRVVSSLTLNSGGTGYTAPTVTLTDTGGTGTGATATVSISGGTITGITLTNGGTGYTGPVSVNITETGASGAAATASLTGIVSGITIGSAGANYTSPPTVTLTGGGGTGAAAAASLNPTSITSVNVFSGGSNYTTPPTVVFSGGGPVSSGNGSFNGATAVNGVALATSSFTTPAQSLTVSGQPDLRITGVNYPANVSYRGGDVIPMSLTFTNQSATNGTPNVPFRPATGSTYFRIQVVLSSNPTYGDADDFLLTFLDFSDTLSADDGKHTFSWNQLLPGNFAGSYYVLAKIDSLNAVSELTENDLTRDGDNIWQDVAGTRIALLPTTFPTMYLASSSTTGTSGNGYSDNPSITSDGRYTVYASDAANLVASSAVGGLDTNNVRDIFLYDSQTGTTRRLSLSQQGAQTNGSSNNPAISANGRYVAFSSDATNLVLGDNNGFSDIFVVDVITGAITLESVASNGAGGALGTQANGSNFKPSLSSDGRYLVYESSATNLVSPATTVGVTHIYLRDRNTGVTTLVSRADGAAGTQGNGNSIQAVISADGKFVAFASQASNLVANDTNGLRDVFLRDLTAATTIRVSVGTGNVQSVPSAIGGDSRAPSISETGRYIAYSSEASNLVAGDTNGMADIFVYDRNSATTTRVSVSSSGGEAIDPAGNPFVLGSINPNISATGRYVTYASMASNLAPGDSVGRYGTLAAATVASAPTAGPVTGITITNPGVASGSAYYTSVPSVTITGGGGTGATATVTLSNGSAGYVTAITLGSGGSGYTSAPTVTLNGEFNAALNIYVADRAVDGGATFDTPGNISTSLVSVNKFGYQTIRVLGVQSTAASDIYPVISADGRWVAMPSDAEGSVGLSTTTTNLLSNDSNGARDVFLHDRRTNSLPGASTPPTVTITSPGSNSTLLVNTPITIAASATAATVNGTVLGVVSSVQFYVNGTSVGTSTTFPYSASWTPTAVGNYTLSALVTDSFGNLGVSPNVTVTINAAPSVGLTSPTNGSSITVNSPVTVTASAAATTPGATITDVKFYANGTLIGTDAVPAYSTTWTPTATGSYTLTAVATDSNATVTTSTAVTVTVASTTGGGNTGSPPTVVLAAPPANTSINTRVVLSATATAATGLTITNVEFLVNGAVVGSATTPPYTTPWTPAAAGVYSITARATDNLGGSATSSPAATVTVNGSFSVQITAPAAAAVLSVNTPQAITASAGFTNGTVTSVQFFANGASIGSVNAFPYTLTWTPTTPGAYTLTAVGTNNVGEQSVSTGVPVTVSAGTAPGAVIASPLAGSTVPVGQPQVIVANATAGTGTIASVQFFANGASLGTDTSYPYNFVWTPSGPGPVSLTIDVIDSLGNRTTSAAVGVTVAPSSVGAPTVSISSPTAGTSQPVGTAVTVTAAATDADGLITNVTFLANGVQIGTDNTYPYSVTFTPTAVGTYTLTAIATDDGGNVATSAASALSVVGGDAPTVAISAPIFGATLDVGTTQNIVATASAGSGTISAVEFFVNGVSLGVKTSFPYTIAWTPTAIGTYSLTARATNSFGNTTLSAAVVASVVAGSTTLPKVSLTSPPNGTAVTVGDQVFVGANATDPDGVVIGVEFYVNDRLIGSKAAAPYFAFWTPVAAGTYTVKAVATDDGGNRSTSAVSTITVSNASGTLPTAGLRFNNPAVDTPTGAAPTPIDPLVPVKVDFGSKLILRADGVKEDGTITNVQFFANGVNIGSLTAAPFFTTYQLNTLSDVAFVALVTDSAGNSVYTNPILISTQATSGNANSVVTLVSPKDGATYVDGAQITFSATHNFGTVNPPKIDFYLNGSQFSTVSAAPYQTVLGITRAGTYVVHAVLRSGTTTTVSAPARITVTSSRAPTVALTGPSASTTYTVGTPLTIAANAVSTTGLISNVQFFVNGATLSAKNTSPYTAAWSPGSAGSYTLTAIATDDSGNQTISAPLAITIVANSAPTVSVANPASGVTVGAGTVISLSASAADADGVVASVRFLANGTAVGPAATNTPFTTQWTPTAPGTYTVIAQATDNSGNVTSSSPIQINVTPNTAPAISLTAPVSGAVVRTGLGTTLVASATDADGTITSVQFFANGTPIAAAVTTLSPLGGYRLPWIPAAEGVYRLTAVALDNAGASTTSSTVMVLAVSAASGGTDNVYTGSYSGGGEIGRFAVINLRGKTAAFIGYSTTTPSRTYYYPGLALDVAGGFSVPDALGRSVISGNVNETGVSGTLDNNRAIFIGPISFTAANAAVSAGYYTGSLTGRSSSALAAIVGPDGSIMFYVSDGSFQAAGNGSLDSSGSFSVPVTGGARFTGKLDLTTGFLTGSLSGANGGAFMAATSSGISFSDGFLRNLSTRGQVGTGANILIAGFVVGGTVPKQVLVRAIGPTLSSFGVTGVLADPQLQIFNSSGALVTSNNNWGGSAEVANAVTAVGTFPLAANSLDSALVIQLAPGAYTAQISGVGSTTGIALVELYDVDSQQPFSSQKVMNVATRGVVGTSQGQLIAGFVVSGTTAKKVLIRGVGPTLAAAPFNVGGVLVDPVLRLMRGDNLVVRENDNWEMGNDAALINDAATKVGAFPLAAGGKDSAMLLNLPPGIYNAQVSGANSTTGVALIEVYEVP